MNEKETEIVNAIEALPVCKDAKLKVKDLVKALGYKIDTVPKVKSGQVWKWCNAHYVVTGLMVAGERFRGLNIDNKLDSHIDNQTLINESKYVCDSLAEYFKG